MNVSELVAVGFVRRLLESAELRASSVGDEDLRVFLCNRVHIIERVLAKEAMRRKQDQSKPAGIALRLLPACNSAELRGTLATALTTCQALLPQLPEWALTEIRHVHEHCRQPVHSAGGDKI